MNEKHLPIPVPTNVNKLLPVEHPATTSPSVEGKQFGSEVHADNASPPVSKSQPADDVLDAILKAYNPCGRPG
jgi:hypothetical protein